MAVAFDAFTRSSGSGAVNFTHTPVGTPRGVIVLISQGVSSDAVAGVTYGGVAMTEISGSPNLKATAETGGVHGFFLGSGIPTGAQTVSVDNGGVTATKLVHAITITASDDTEIVDSDATINSDSVANPSVTLSLSGRTSFCVLELFTGQGSPSGFAPLTSWTSRDETDVGLFCLGCYTYDTIGSSDVTAGWTQTAEDAVMIAVAVSEASVAATSYTFTGPTSGTVNVASTNFTVTPNGTSSATVTPATDGSGSFTPGTVTFDGSAAAKTFTYTPTDTAGSPHTLSVTDDGGLTDPSSIDYTVNAAPTGNRRRRFLIGACH